MSVEDLITTITKTEVRVLFETDNQRRTMYIRCDVQFEPLPPDMLVLIMTR